MTLRLLFFPNRKSFDGSAAWQQTRQRTTISKSPQSDCFANGSRNRRSSDMVAWIRSTATFDRIDRNGFPYSFYAESCFSRLQSCLHVTPRKYATIQPDEYEAETTLGAQKGQGDCLRVCRHVAANCKASTAEIGREIPRRPRRPRRWNSTTFSIVCLALSSRFTDLTTRG